MDCSTAKCYGSSRDGPWSQVIPIMMRPKTNSTALRAIMDLSRPRGNSVNVGIRCGHYQGAPSGYMLPNVIDVANEVQKSARDGQTVDRRPREGARTANSLPTVHTPPRCRTQQAALYGHGMQDIIPRLRQNHGRRRLPLEEAEALHPLLHRRFRLI